MQDIAHSHPLVQNAREELMLLYSDDLISSYTENIMRGEGVVSVSIDPGNSLRIYTPEDVFYGEIYYAKDLSFTLKMPGRIVARKVIPTHDFMAFEFDSLNPDADKDHIFIFLNGEKMKIKKADTVFNYLPWEEYIMAQVIALKPSNRLHVYENGQNVLLDDNVERVFRVKEIERNIMHLASTASGCCTQKSGPAEGWVRWKHDNVLLVNFAID